jgi:hypothetical protein
MWVSVASARPCVCVGRIPPSVNLHGGLTNHLLLMFNSAAIILRAHRQSRAAISRIFAIASAFREAEGRLLLGSSWRSSRPSLNRLNNSNTIQKPVYERQHCHHKPIYQLESFSSCFARFESKLNTRSLLHHYTLSQRSARYKILNTAEHERQERSDWPRAGHTMAESTYTDKLKHVPACF